VVNIAVDIFVPTKSSKPHNIQCKYPKHIRKLLSKKKACWARVKNLTQLHCLIATRLAQQNVLRPSTNLLLNMKTILLTRAMLALFIDMLI